MEIPVSDIDKFFATWPDQQMLIDVPNRAANIEPIRTALQNVFRQCAFKDQEESYILPMIGIAKVSQQLRELSGEIPTTLRLTFAALFHQILEGDTDNMLRLAEEVKETRDYPLGVVVAHDVLSGQKRIDEGLEHRALHIARLSIEENRTEDPIMEVYSGRVICAASDSENEVLSQLKIADMKYSEQERWRHYTRAVNAGKTNFSLKLIDQLLDESDIPDVDNDHRRAILLKSQMFHFDGLVRELLSTSRVFDGEQFDSQTPADVIVEMEEACEALMKMPHAGSELAWGMYRLATSYARVGEKQKATSTLTKLLPIAQRKEVVGVINHSIRLLDHTENM